MTSDRKRRFDRELESARPHVRARSGGRCERCCRQPAVHVHHKAGRDIPGANRLALLAHLCDRCHRHVHAEPAESYRDGWLVHTWDVTDEEPTG